MKLLGNPSQGVSFQPREGRRIGLPWVAPCSLLAWQGTKFTASFHHSKAKREPVSFKPKKWITGIHGTVKMYLYLSWKWQSFQEISRINMDKLPCKFMCSISLFLQRHLCWTWPTAKSEHVHTYKDKPSKQKGCQHWFISYIIHGSNLGSALQNYKSSVRNSGIWISCRSRPWSFT